MSDVFLSYRHVNPDQGLAAELEQFLHKQQISTFVDTRIRIGQEWVKAIEEALECCLYFVVLLSRESILSDMVRREIALAHQLFRSGQIRRIFPVRINFDGTFPFDIGGYLDPIQYVPWRDGEDFQRISEAILAEIRNQDQESPPKSAPEPTDEELRELAEATELRGAPLPKYDARLETGAVRLNSRFYVARPTDFRAEQLACESGETVLVKAPRQFGKTSLLSRVVRNARDSGRSACLIDLQRTPETHWQSVERFAFFLAQRIARELQISVSLEDRWHPDLGAENLTDFLQDFILDRSERPIVLCLDEVDAVFDRSWRRGFFATLRGWHNLRALDDRWNNLNVFLAHATDAALWLDDPNQSPFNVGEKIEPPEFTLEDVRRLRDLHNLKLTHEECLDILELTGGHPFLVRQTLYSCCRQPYSLIKKTASRDDGAFGDHLRGRLWAVRKKPALVDALRTIVQEGFCRDEEPFQRLRGAALIRGSNRTAVAPRCRLYRDYFREHL